MVRNLPTETSQRGIRLDSLRFPWLPLSCVCSCALVYTSVCSFGYIPTDRLADRPIKLANLKPTSRAAPPALTEVRKAFPSRSTVPSSAVSAPPKGKPDNSFRFLNKGADQHSNHYSTDEKYKDCPDNTVY